MTTPARTRTRTHRTGVVRTGSTSGTAAGRVPATGRTPATSGRAPAAPASGRATRSTPTKPDLWLVPDAGPSRTRRAAGRRRAPFVLLVVALLVLTTLGLLVLNTAIAVDSLKATHLRTENAQRQEDVQRLEQQVVDGSTPEQLAAAAAAAGMVPAAPPGYLVLEDGGGSAVRGTPEPAPGPTPATAPAPADAASPADRAGD